MAITTASTGLDGHGLEPEGRVFWNPSTSLLYTHSLARGDASLAEGLDATKRYYDRLTAESREVFAELTDERLSEKCLTPPGTPITVSKWLRAMVEHEAHHRGQIYFILGMRGVKTPPIFGLTVEQLMTFSS